MPNFSYGLPIFCAGATGNFIAYGKEALFAMTYDEAVRYIKSTGVFGSKLGLEVMTDLLGKMGNPQTKFKTIHIAGTNGKGSASAYISSALCANGYKTGLFTSPPIIDETERIQINGEFADREDFGQITEYVKHFADEIEADGLHYPTEFELFTAIAFEYFARKKVDFAVVEVGLGGRLDATNICVPAICVIMTIALDHTQWLGDTLEKIAYEKAGIIKNGAPVVIYPELSDGVRRVIKDEAKKNGSTVYDTSDAKITIRQSDITGNVFDYKDGSRLIENVQTSLIGMHQIKNCTTALGTLLVMKDMGFDISVEKTLEGLKNARWPGRFDIVRKSPLVIFDGGHNEQCMRALVNCVDMYLKPYKKILVFSMFADKDCVNSVKLLKGKFDVRIVTEMKHKRRAAAEYIAQQFDEETIIIKDTSEAVQRAVHMALECEADGQKSAVVVCGSLNLLEEIVAGMNFKIEKLR